MSFLHNNLSPLHPLRGSDLFPLPCSLISLMLSYRRYASIFLFFVCVRSVFVGEVTWVMVVHLSPISYELKFALGQLGRNGVSKLVRF